MRIPGKRIHIAGSAGRKTPREKLVYAHSLITAIVESLAMHGARFVVGVGKEPLLDEADPSSPSLIFDWTVLKTLGDLINQGVLRPDKNLGRLVATLGTGKTEDQIPDGRRDLWSVFSEGDLVRLEFVDPGRTSGAVRRTRLVQLGDVLIALSGGEGTEHLSQLYAQAGKPVIPLDLDMGSSMADGSGGAARLAGRALATPARYTQLRDAGAGGLLFANLSTRSGGRPVEEVAAALLRLLDAIVDPTAFYVRLLNPEVNEYKAVEHFFRNVVDPEVAAFGYNPIEVGRESKGYAWMNQEVFDQLHHSQLVIVDLTASRPNCFMEFGYALGRATRVLITAKHKTKIPFDAEMLEHYQWNEAADDEQGRDGFRSYWLRNIDRPPIVRPREVL